MMADAALGLGQRNGCLHAQSINSICPRIPGPIGRSTSYASGHPIAPSPRLARSTALAASALSSYPLMELRRAAGSSASVGTGSRGPSGAVGSHAWLAACVRHIVSSGGQQHGRGPTLQLVFSGAGGASHRFQTVPISAAVADNPQNWDVFASTVSSSGASGLVLVRPIPSPEQHCIYASAATSAVASASASNSFAASPAVVAPCCGESGVCGPGPSPSFFSTSAAAPSSSLPLNSQIEGDVGDCCGGTQGHSHSYAQPSPHQQVQRPEEPQAEQPTAYYGLVVQGAASSDTDGCWVLKTSRSGSGAPAGVCSCTHFTLTRVCMGQPLYAQLRDAWLVPQ